MFSYTTTSCDNQYQLYPSFSLPSFAGQNGDLFVHYDHDLLAGHLFPDNASVFDETQPAFHPEGQNGDDHNIRSRKKKPAGKDRHSKIFTSQGPRDRRIRLSIEVSRKFFALQDMLGFDKASKTLDWLFTKSEAAISDLEQMKHSYNGEKSLSSTSECGVESGGTNETVDSSVDTKGLVSIPKTNKVKKRRQLQKTTLHIPAKELRKKARARARERTREKMCVKELPVPADFKQPSILNQSKSGCCKKLGSHSQNYILSSSKVDSEASEQTDCFQWLVNHASGQYMVDESIVIKRKALNTPIFAFQENPTVFRDVNFNDSNNSYPNTIASSVLQICSKL